MGEMELRSWPTWCLTAGNHHSLIYSSTPWDYGGNGTPFKTYMMSHSRETPQPNLLVHSLSLPTAHWSPSDRPSYSCPSFHPNLILPAVTPTTIAYPIKKLATSNRPPYLLISPTLVPPHISSTTANNINLCEPTPMLSWTRISRWAHRSSLRKTGVWITSLYPSKAAGSDNILLRLIRHLAWLHHQRCQNGPLHTQSIKGCRLRQHPFETHSSPGLASPPAMSERPSPHSIHQRLQAQTKSIWDSFVTWPGFTTSDVRTALSTLNSSKAAGSDNILLRVIRHLAWFHHQRCQNGPLHTQSIKGCRLRQHPFETHSSPGLVSPPAMSERPSPHSIHQRLQAQTKSIQDSFVTGAQRRFCSYICFSINPGSRHPSHRAGESLTCDWSQRAARTPKSWTATDQSP